MRLAVVPHLLYHPPSYTRTHSHPLGIIISTSLPVHLGTHSVKGQPGGGTAWTDLGQALAALRQATGWRARLQAAWWLLTAVEQRATELCGWDDGAAAARRAEEAHARAEREQRHRAHMQRALELWHQLQQHQGQRQQRAQLQQGRQKDLGGRNEPGSSSGCGSGAAATSAAAQPPAQQLSWDAGRLRARHLCQECAEQEQRERAWRNAFLWATRLGWTPLLLAITWAAALLLPVPT